MLLDSPFLLARLRIVLALSRTGPEQVPDTTRCDQGRVIVLDMNRDERSV
jgi:hypothetical protein